MTTSETGEAAKAVIRRNTEEVQGGGNFDVFEELLANDFLDHTPQPGRTPDKDGARSLQNPARPRFPTFMPTSIGSLPMATACQTSSAIRVFVLDHFRRSSEHTPGSGPNQTPLPQGQTHLKRP